MLRTVSTVRLTSTSYVVLGMLERHEPATPYELKQEAATWLGYFWPVPHTQLYNEPARMARTGYLDEQQETSGRRRKLYRLTGQGREALTEWRSNPTAEMTEIRDLALLQLVFGVNPAALAETQIAAHEKQLALYESLASGGPPVAIDAQRFSWALDAGIGHEREWLAFWRKVANDSTP